MFLNDGLADRQAQPRTGVAVDAVSAACVGRLGVLKSTFRTRGTGLRGADGLMGLSWREPWDGSTLATSGSDLEEDELEVLGVNSDALVTYLHAQSDR